MSRTVDLGPHFDKVVDDLVASGRYPSADVALRHAVGMLEAVEAERASKLEKLRALIREGIESGDGGVWDKDAFLAEAKARLAARSVAAE